MARKICNFSVFLIFLLFSVGSVFAVNLEKLASDEWHEFKSPHFHVVSDADLEVAEKFVQDLENFRFFISFILKLGILEGVPPVKILAVEQPSNFRSLGLPRIWGGVFSQSPGGSFAIANIHNYRTSSRKSSWGKGILMHEYVHYAMSNTFDRMYYPLWYSEGMAEYLSTFQYNDTQITLGNLDVIGDRFVWLARSGRFTTIGLEDLFKTKSLNFRPEKKAQEREISRFYARATAAMHYFKAADATGRDMQKYIQLLNMGYEIDQAFQEAFGRSFAEVDEDIRNYLNGKAIGLTYKAGEGGMRFPVIKPAIKKLDAGSVYYYMSDFLTRFGFLSIEEEQRILEESIQKNPDNPDLKAMLADHFFIDDPEKSETILKEILARHPGHAAAHAVYGDLIFSRARLRIMVGLDGWETLLNEARDHYRLAVKNDAYYGRPYQGIGYVYSYKMDKDLLEEGAVSLDSARFFADQAMLPHLYLAEARLRIRMRDYKNAISAFRGYINLSNGDFGFSPGFGRYVYDALAYRELSEVQYRQEGGRYVYADGSVYTGDWRNGRPNGKGQLVRANGATFKGVWSDGLMVGKGEFISSNGFHYIGDFTKGEITGSGVLIYPAEQGAGGRKTGEEREEEQQVKESRGEFFNAMEHGEQEFIFKSGDRSVGRYWMAAAHGPERYYKADGGSIVYDRVLGSYRMELGGDLVYSGGKDKDGKAHGRGACQNKKDMRFYWCKFDHGVEVKNSDQNKN